MSGILAGDRAIAFRVSMMHEASFLRMLVRMSRRWILRIVGTSVAASRLCEPKLILVVAPHPDDEVLGCGGLIAKVIAAGGQAHVVVLTGGGRSHEGCCDTGSEVIARKRRGLAVEAGGKLTLVTDRLVFLNWPDGRIGNTGSDDTAKKVAELAGWITRLRPEAVFAPHPFESWPDHEAAERITRLAIERSGIACRLFYYCVWFWSSMPLRRVLKIDWRSARILDIAAVYAKKQAAIDAYLKPCAPCGHPWSGVLPRELLHAFKWRKELFFEADRASNESCEDSGAVIRKA